MDLSLAFLILGLILTLTVLFSFLIVRIQCLEKTNCIYEENGSLFFTSKILGTFHECIKKYLDSHLKFLYASSFSLLLTRKKCSTDLCFNISGNGRGVMNTCQCFRIIGTAGLERNI